MIFNKKEDVGIQILLLNLNHKGKYLYHVDSCKIVVT